MAFLSDGYQTLITFAGLPGALFREREVQPPSQEVGSVDTTTMRNIGVRTKQPKHLATLGDVVAHVQYDPHVNSQIIGTILGVINIITITFPDGQVESAPGWLDKFTPSSHKEGDFPTAELRICFSQQDANGTLHGATLP